jgi:hemolysin type calcium-binding protein
MIEPLEHRRYLSATLEAEDATIRVEGNDGDDIITVVKRGGRIVVTENRVRTTFDAAGVSTVDVRSGAGDDRVIALGRFDLRLVVLGGDGDDVIIGALGNDQLIGASGTDRLLGRGGNDTLSADGADFLDAGPGDDDLRIGPAGTSNAVNGGVALGGPGDDSFIFSRGGGIPRLLDGGSGGDAAAIASLPAGVVEDFVGPFLRRIEATEHGSNTPAANPMVQLYATRADDGTVTVFAQASHGAGGFTRQFGELLENAETPRLTRFSAQVTGTDVGEPNVPRTAAVERDTHEYNLGKLKPGTYTFTALAGTEIRATLQIRVTSDGLRDVPSKPAHS